MATFILILFDQNIIMRSSVTRMTQSMAQHDTKHGTKRDTAQYKGWHTGGVSEFGQRERNDNLCQDLLTTLLCLPIHRQAPLQGHNFEHHLHCQLRDLLL